MPWGLRQAAHSGRRSWEAGGGTVDWRRPAGTEAGYVVGMSTCHQDVLPG